MLKKLHCMFSCWLDEHVDTIWTGYDLGTGQLRVVRCQKCNRLMDVLFLTNSNLYPMSSEDLIPERFR